MLVVCVFSICQSCPTLFGHIDCRRLTRLLCPWDAPGKTTGVGCHFLLQGLFPTQGSNPRFFHLLHWQVDSLPRLHLGSLDAGWWSMQTTSLNGKMGAKAKHLRRASDV